MWSLKGGCQSLLPWTGPLGGLWTTCAQPEQMRAHPHSEVPASVQSDGALGFGQTVRHTLWDTQNRGSGIQLLCAGPWVQGP